MSLRQIATFRLAPRQLYCIMFAIRAQSCLLLIFCIFVGALGQSARLTEQTIDLLPPSNAALEGMQEPRHLSGYFTVR